MFRHYKRFMKATLALPVLLVLSGAARGEVGFELKPHKPTIVLGEPLIVSTVVKNLTNLPIDVFYQNSPAYNRRDLSVAIIRLSEEVPPALPDPASLYGWFRHTWSDEFRPVRRRKPSTLRLDPGEDVTFKLVVLYRRTEGYAFEEPGEFWISARIVVVAPNGENPPNYDIVAEPVAVTVNEPQYADQAVWGRLNAHKEEYGRLIQIPWMAKLSDDFVAECRELCATSDSVYVEYLALFLSRWYSEGPGRDPAEASRYLEIAKTRATSEIVRNLASKPLPALAMKGQEEREQPNDQPVSPELRKVAEDVFQEFLKTAGSGDIDRCLELTAEDFRGWSRTRQRKWLQDDFDENEDLRRRGVPIDLSAHVLTVVRRGDDLLLTGLITYHQGSKPPTDSTVRCRLRKYGDQWLIQDWNSLLNGK